MVEKTCWVGVGWLFGMLLNGKMVNGRTVGTCDASWISKQSQSVFEAWGFEGKRFFCHPSQVPPFQTYTHKSVKKEEREVFKLYDFNFICRAATPRVQRMMKIISLLSGRMSLKIIIESFFPWKLLCLTIWEGKKKSLREVTFRLIAIKLNLSRRLGTLNLGYTRESQLDSLLPKKKFLLFGKKHVTGVLTWSLK